MSTKANVTDTMDDRLKKAKVAWAHIKKSFITDLKINTKLRINYYKALIATILLYSIHIHPINETSLRKIQFSHSNCIQYIINGRYTKGK